jgi:hypothetical protein
LAPRSRRSRASSLPPPSVSWDLLAQDLTSLDLVALLVDGVGVAEHCYVVALGITIDGAKIPLALAEGATENAAVVGDLLVGLHERGLDTADVNHYTLLLPSEGPGRWPGRSARSSAWHRHRQGRPDPLGGKGGSGSRPG